MQVDDECVVKTPMADIRRVALVALALVVGVAAHQLLTLFGGRSLSSSVGLLAGVHLFLEPLCVKDE